MMSVGKTECLIGNSHQVVVVDRKQLMLTLVGCQGKKVLQYAWRSEHPMAYPGCKY